MYPSIRDSDVKMGQDSRKAKSKLRESLGKVIGDVRQQRMEGIEKRKEIKSADAMGN